MEERREEWAKGYRDKAVRGTAFDIFSMPLSLFPWPSSSSPLRFGLNG
jgi:hypothetical protein